MYDPKAPMRMYMMSEDHVFSLLRERQRTLGKNGRKDWMGGATSSWLPLPANAVALPNSDRTAILSPFEVGYPSHERLQCAQDAIDLVKSICSVTGTIEPEKLSLEALALLASPKVDTMDMSLHSTLSGSDLDDSVHSIRRRKSGSNDEASEGEGHSGARLTRSVGDVEGPEQCIPLPEISAVTIESHECARFVMATDAVWACMSHKSVRDAAISIDEPNVLAEYLATKAAKRLYATRKEKVDVSVVVVDVNHNLLMELSDKMDSTKKKAKCTIV
jgi:hypothetical protein